MNQDLKITFWSMVLAFLGAVHPEAAAGAVCGGMFFWALSPEIPISTRLMLLAGSVGLGYGMAIPAVRSDSGWAWIVAGLGASLVHVVLVALRAMVKTGSPVPPWMKDILAVIPTPWRKDNGGGDNQ